MSDRPWNQDRQRRSTNQDSRLAPACSRCVVCLIGFPAMSSAAVLRETGRLSDSLPKPTWYSPITEGQRKVGSCESHRHKEPRAPSTKTTLDLSPQPMAQRHAACSPRTGGTVKPTRLMRRIAHLVEYLVATSTQEHNSCRAVRRYFRHLADPTQRLPTTPTRRLRSFYTAELAVVAARRRLVNVAAMAFRVRACRRRAARSVCYWSGGHH